MKLYRAFATVGGLTVISRILGFVRDILIALLLGTGPVADAFVVAFRFPNLFRRIFAEGAFNSAFIPLFSKTLEGEGISKARAFAEDAMAILLITLLVLLTLAELLMPWLIYIIAPGFSDTPDKLNLSILLTRITFPYLLFISIVALLSGVLNALGKFAAAAAAPVLLNIVLISVMSFVLLFGIEDQRIAGIYLCWGVFLAGVLQLLMLIQALKNQDIKFRFKFPKFTPQISQLLKLGVPGIIAGGVTQVNILIGTIIASQQDSAVSYLYYADRIYQLPLGIVGIAIGIVLLPDLSKHLRAGNMQAVHNSQNRSLEFSLMLTLPASVALFTIPEPIIRVLFERGAFVEQDSQATALALAAFAWGLPSFVMIKVFSPAFFARENTKTPMIYATMSMIINVILSFIFFNYWGHVGIAIATTISGWANALLLWVHLVRIKQFELDNKLLKSIIPMIVSSITMGIVLWGIYQLSAQYLTPQNVILIQFLALSALVCLGFIIYAAMAHITGALHLPTFMRMLMGRKPAG